DRIEGGDGGDRNHDDEEEADRRRARADAFGKGGIEGADDQLLPEGGNEEGDDDKHDGKARQLRRQFGKRRRVKERGPAFAGKPDQAFKIAVKGMLDIEMDIARIGTLQKKDAGGKQRGEDRKSDGK